MTFLTSADFKVGAKKIWDLLHCEPTQTHSESLSRLRWRLRVRACALPVAGRGVARGGSAEEEGGGPWSGVGDRRVEAAAAFAEEVVLH